MLNTHWKDGGDNWTTGSDWSTGAEPSSTDDVLIDQGLPLINTNVGAIHSLTIADDGVLSLAGGGALTVEGDAYVEGFLALDEAVALGQSGAPGAVSLTVDGELVNSADIFIGSGKQTDSVTLTAANFSNEGTLALLGSATNTATLDVLGSAGGSDGANLLAGEVLLAGDALLEFGTGQFTGIAQNAELSINGAGAFVADASDPTSDSALDLSSNQGTLALNNGASLTTAAGFVNRAAIGLANTDDAATTTALIIDNSTAAVANSAGALVSDISVSGDSLLEFEGGGQIASVAYGGSLSLSGANAFIADEGAITSNSAIGALTSNDGSLSLDDGVSLTTAAGFTESDDAELSVANDDAPTTTSLIVNNTTAGFSDSSGKLDTDVSVSGDSLLEFEQGGQFTGVGQYVTLTLSGAQASIADAGGTSLNSALNLSSNLGDLELDDGASLTTAAGFTNGGYIGLSNDDNAATATTLSVNNTTAGFEDSTSALDSDVSVSGDSEIVFNSGQIAGISNFATLSLSGAKAFIADQGATTSDSALALTYNAGRLELDDGASVTTAAGFTDTGDIELGNDDDATTTTTLVVENSTAGFGNTPGALDDGGISLTGDSVLDFVDGGQFDSIGEDAFLSLDGAGAFVEDATAPNSNSAIGALTSNAGELDLDDGATLTTSATFVDTGSIYLGTYSSTTAVSKLIAGSATSFASGGTFTGLVELGNSALLDFADGGKITGIAADAEIGVDGTTAFIADADDQTHNSALSNLASNAGTLELDEGASVTTTGPLNNTGEVDLSDPLLLDQHSPTETTAELLATPPISTLDVGSAAGLGAAGTIKGAVKLGNDSLLEFVSGKITTVGDDASLSIDGPNAFVADSDDTTRNSALDGLSNLDSGSTLKLDDGAAVTTTGGLTAAEDSGLTLDGGAALTINGALTEADASIDLTGATAITTTLDIKATAGFGTAGTLTGEVSLSGNSLLEFAENQITTISTSGELVIDGDDAFVADESAPTSNSALAGLDDIAGEFTLEAGASVTTAGQLKSTGDVRLEDAAKLIVTGDAAEFGDASGDLEGELEVSGGSLLEFTEGGQIAGIADDAALSLSGATSYVADGGQTSSSSALAGLADNAGELSLDDGATITTTGALLNTGRITLGDDYSTTTATSTLDIGGSADDFGASGALLGEVDLAGDSLLEFHGGQITAIGSSTSFSYSELSINGPNAFVADAGATSSNSALDSLDDLYGALSLDNGASITTSVALNNTAGDISLGSANDSTGGPVSILSIGSAAGLGAVGVLNGEVYLSGNSLLEFKSGEITTISSGSYLSIAGTNAFVGYQGATTSNSALTGLDDNAGTLDLDDGAILTTTGAFTNSGDINLNQNADSSAVTTLDIGASAATFVSTGDITLDNNSLLEFSGGEISSIDDTSRWFIDGPNAFVADKGATTSNSALTGLDDVAGSLYLEAGASLTTNGSLDDAGTLYVDGGYDTPGSTLTVKGTLDDTGFLAVGDNADDSTPSTVNATALTLTDYGSARIDDDGALNVGSLTLGVNSVLDVEAAASAISSAITFAGAGAFLELGLNAVASTGGAFAKAIDGFSTDDTIELKGLKYIEGSTTAMLSGDTLTVTNGATTDTLTLVAPGGTHFETSDDVYGGTDIEVVCFASGTRIRTMLSPGAIVDVAVESLAVGDRVVTASGEARPIRWLGHRTIDCRRHPRPAEVMPVRVAAHAFAPNQPARDLFLSPGHSICVDLQGKALIPAASLVNGATIRQVEVDAVTYWHVELDSHDVILAENLACESYLDMGNRGFFREADTVALGASPDAKRGAHADFRYPFHADGAVVERARAMLRRRAKTLGFRVTGEADAHLIADGRRIEPVWLSDTRLSFALPAGVSKIRLRSRSFIPAHTRGGNEDGRNLGLCVGRLQIDGREIALDDDCVLGQGWRDLEGDGGAAWRWTNGEADLPALARLVVIDLKGRGYYLVSQDEAARAVA